MPQPLFQGPLIKGFFGRIKDGEVVSIFDFQFNPPEVTRSRTVDYEFDSSPASVLPSAYFKAITGDTITIQLLLDAVETYKDSKKGTLAQQAFLESLTCPEFDEFSEEVGSFVSPPPVLYCMGEQSWKVVIPSLQFRDVRWNKYAIPTRTYVDIQMRTYFTDINEIKARYDQLRLLRREAVLNPGGEDEWSPGDWRAPQVAGETSPNPWGNDADLYENTGSGNVAV